MNKPTLIFTNFFEANKAIGLLNGSNIYSVYSIALSHPLLDKLPNLQGITCLDFFCATWEILNKYKKDGDWEDYTKSFNKLMGHMNPYIMEWFADLSEDHIYFLCCWENTSKGAHCHRQLLYETLSQYKPFKDKYNFVYCHG